MGYKWSPSKSQKREFAIRMQDEKEREAYEERKIQKAEKRRSGSKFDYNTAGGFYVPTKAQFDFCLSNINLFKTPQEINALNMVMSAYTCNEKTHHDYIHIVNEKIRSVNVF